MTGAGASPLRAGVAGLGVMGRQHVRILSELPGVELVATCDPSPHAQTWARERLRVPCVATWDELVETGPDAIVNATPTGFHFESTKLFLKAGAHVLVEKPIAQTADEARELIDLAEGTQRALMVGHTERFNPAVRVLKEQIEQGRLGSIVSAASRRVGTARPSIPHVNVALDLAIHDIDVFAYLFDHPGQLLFAAGASLDPNILEDHVDLVIRYGPTVAFAQANWITPVKVRRLSVTGTKGMAELDYIDQTVRIFEAVPDVIKGTPWNFFAISQESEPVDLPVQRKEPLRSELELFVEAARRDESLTRGAEDAARALGIALEATNLMRGKQG